jgi:hypothetical protein
VSDDDLAAKLAGLAAKYAGGPPIEVFDPMADKAARRTRLHHLARMAAVIRDLLEADPRDNAAFVTAEVLARQLAVMEGGLE